jgi:esterase/lipase superfamily enzyme
MRVSTLFFVAAIAAQTCDLVLAKAAGPFDFLPTPSAFFGKVEYDEGVVLSCVDCTDIADGLVEFSTKEPENPGKAKALYLQNIKQVRTEGGTRIFQAEKVPPEKVEELITENGTKKPLFCVHGFNTPFWYYLDSCKKAKKDNPKVNFSLIPVLWSSMAKKPASGLLGIFAVTQDYSAVREQAEEGVAKAFQSLTNGFKDGKSLMTHSMGNFVLAKAANKKFSFDNIFMCAADVDNDIFSREDGRRISQMLSEKGKVFCIYNELDYALTASSGFSFFGLVKSGKKRLGLAGALVDTILPYKGKIENVDGSGWMMNKFEHIYAFYGDAMKFYSSKMA